MDFRQRQFGTADAALGLLHALGELVGIDAGAAQDHADVVDAFFDLTLGPGHQHGLHGAEVAQAFGLGGELPQHRMAGDNFGRNLPRVATAEQSTGETADRASEVQHAGVGGFGTARLRLDRLRIDRDFRCAAAIQQTRRRGSGLKRVVRRTFFAWVFRTLADIVLPVQRRIDLLLAVQHFDNGVLLGLQLVRRRLELVVGRDQRRVHLVVGNLQIGDAVFVSRLHLLGVMLFGGNDAILEDHIDRCECDPAKEDQGKTGTGRLKRGAKGEKLHAAVAAHINLAFGKCLMEPRPSALQERLRHIAVFLFRAAVGADPISRHFTEFWALVQAISPEKRARG